MPNPNSHQLRWPLQDEPADLLVHALAFFDGRVSALLSSGLGLRNLREVSRARACVEFREQSIVARVARSLETRLSGSLMSPNTMASAGQAWAQAGTISPSRIGRLSFLRSCART